MDEFRSNFLLSGQENFRINAFRFHSGTVIIADIYLMIVLLFSGRTWSWNL